METRPLPSSKLRHVSCEPESEPQVEAAGQLAGHIHTRFLSMYAASRHATSGNDVQESLSPPSLHGQPKSTQQQKPKALSDLT